MIRFVPHNQPALWGGRKLETVFGRALPQGPIGESWELVELPEQHTKAKDGPHAGKALGDLWRAGTFGGSKRGPFPFMLKWIDAADTLSVQVHPDEAACERMKKGRPKTEAWYVVQRDEGAKLLMGHHAGLDAKTLSLAASNNTLGKWLYEIEPNIGDMYLLKAGTIHAIGRGHLLLEVQQSSDTTYRINDWGRVGIDGKPRQLHLEEASACIHYDRVGPVVAERKQVRGPCFVMTPLCEGARVGVGGLRVFVADHGPVTVRGDNLEMQLAHGDVVIAEPRDGPLSFVGGSCVLLTEPGPQGAEATV